MLSAMEKKINTNKNYIIFTKTIKFIMTYECSDNKVTVLNHD